MTVMFLPFDGSSIGNPRCDAFGCHNIAVWRVYGSKVLTCWQCYHWAMVEFACQEVDRIIAAYAPASATWNVQSGVSAFEVLAGYNSDDTIRDWIARDASGQGYRRFIDYWNSRVS